MFPDFIRDASCLGIRAAVKTRQSSRDYRIVQETDGRLTVCGHGRPGKQRVLKEFELLSKTAASCCRIFPSSRIVVKRKEK